jgi:hypothetical protein
MIHFSNEVKLQNILFFYSTYSINVHLDMFMRTVLERSDVSNLTPAEERVIKRLKRFMFNVVRYKDRAQHSFAHVNLNTGMVVLYLNGDLHAKAASGNIGVLQVAREVGSYHPTVAHTTTHVKG